MSIRNRLANPLRAFFRGEPSYVGAHGRQGNPGPGATPERYEGMGIYDPAEPSIDVLPPEARAAYEDAHAQAMARYGDKGIAESTAWRKVKLSWRPGAQQQWEACSGGACKPWPADRKMPVPKSDLIGLGVLIEYGYIGRDGVLRVQSTDADMPPILWWDDKRKYLYAFPGMPYPGCSIVNPNRDANAAQLYETWTKRKPSCGTTDMKIDIRTIRCMGAADTVSYRSDKWKNKMDDARVVGAQEYIHKHWHDVRCWLDREKNPRVILIEGGALDMHAKGIIH